MPFPCPQCVAVAINGVPTHETGCPEAWRDYAVRCRECGCDFTPTERQQAVCDECVMEDRDEDDARESAADRHTRWEEQGRPLDPPADERESSLDDDQRGGGPDSD